MLTNFASMSDDDIFETIGQELSGQLDTHNDLIDTAQTPLGFNIGDDCRDIGLRLYLRVKRELFALFCSTAEADIEDRSTLLRLSGASSVVASAFVTGLITKYLGISAAIASALAFVFVKRILMPAGAELCGFWGDHLG